MYITRVLLFGLLQVWLLLLFLLAKPVNFMPFDLVRTGSLFFFSTSIATASFHAFTKVNHKFDERFRQLVLFVFIGILVFCVVGFLSAISIDETKKTFSVTLNNIQHAYQFFIALVTLFFGYYLDKKINTVAS